MHKLDIYKSKVKLINTEHIFDKGISLPSYPNLTLKDVDKICRVIKLFFKSLNKWKFKKKEKIFQFLKM